MKALVLIPPSRFSKNVARDLIYGCWCKGKRIGGIKFPPVSQLLVATVLECAGHDTTLIDAAAQRIGIEELKKIIKDRYGCVIVLTSKMTIKEDAGILNELKKINGNLKTIVFGGQPTFMPQDTLKYKGIDFV